MSRCAPTSMPSSQATNGPVLSGIPSTLGRAALLPGTVLGPYRVDALLGAGGMGEVYKAHDTRLKRDVAIKVLPARVLADPDRLARFEREAHAAAALNHPNICAVFDIGMHDGAPFIVSELLDGETLRQVCAAGPLGVRRAVEYAVPDRTRPRGRARQGHRPSGPEAREPLRHGGGSRQDPRLRPGQADRPCRRRRDASWPRTTR